MCIALLNHADFTEVGRLYGCWRRTVTVTAGGWNVVGVGVVVVVGVRLVQHVARNTRPQTVAHGTQKLDSCIPVYSFTCRFCLLSNANYDTDRVWGGLTFLCDHMCNYRLCHMWRSILFRFPNFPVLHFPPPVRWCRYFQSRIFRSRIFSAPLRSNSSIKLIAIPQTKRNLSTYILNTFKRKWRFLAHRTSCRV